MVNSHVNLWKNIHEPLNSYGSSHSSATSNLCKDTTTNDIFHIYWIDDFVNLGKAVFSFRYLLHCVPF